MELRFELSGTVLFKTNSECVPTIGSVVEIRTDSYKKGLNAGSIISVPITDENPPRFVFTEGDIAVVYIEVNGYEIIQEGPTPD